MTPPAVETAVGITEEITGAEYVTDVVAVNPVFETVNVTVPAPTPKVQTIDVSLQDEIAKLTPPTDTVPGVEEEPKLVPAIVAVVEPSVRGRLSGPAEE